MSAGFRFTALEASLFVPLFSLSDEELERRNVRRMTADAFPGFPCRVSLQDAAVGEQVLLLPFEHHAAASPYRSSGPIYVRTNAVTAVPEKNEVPVMFRHRRLSLRSYDAAGMMTEACVTEGAVLEQDILRLFGRSAVENLHVHNAGPGCFNCSVRRA